MGLTSFFIARRLRIVFLPLPLLLSVSCLRPTAEPALAKIPGDFAIRASSYAILTDLKQTVSITSTGEARLETVEGGQVTVQLLPQVKASLLRRIIATTKKVDFFSLRPSYSGTLTDGQVHTLELTFDGRTHKVEVEALRHLVKDSSDVRRFAKVWVSVFEATPGDDLTAAHSQQ